MMSVLSALPPPYLSVKGGHNYFLLIYIPIYYSKEVGIADSV
jgi:hypothetical protein